MQLETLKIHSTDDAGAAEKTREETCPGQPFIVFSVKPTVQVVLENPTPRSGLFTITSDISTGDTATSFTSKIAKIVGLKGKCKTRNKNGVMKLKQIKNNNFK